MDIKKFLKTSAKFCVFCIVLVSIIGVISVLTSPPVSTGITVTTGKVTDHNLQTSVEVTLEGENDSYNLSMIGPEGTEVSSAFTTEAEMADGKQSVWMEFVEDSKSEVAAKPGTYSLAITNSSGNKVYEQTFGPYSGSNLSVIDTDVSTDYKIYSGRLGLDKAVTLTVKNDGDLPAYISRVDAEFHSTLTNRKGGMNVSQEKEVILPGKTTSVTPTILILPGPYYSSEYPITFKFKEGPFGRGKTVAVYLARI